ncbi:MAG: hypothetical protein GX483_00630 [Actinomycetaceae bacterium]|nr:hypothetical protein [Actinomycetaceae bacterium]
MNALPWTFESLQDMSTYPVFQRAYGLIGKVRVYPNDKGKIVASVEGGERYTVIINVFEDGFLQTCSCPHSQKGNVCKHFLATALKLLLENASVEVQPKVERITDPLRMLPSPLASASLKLKELSSKELQALTQELLAGSGEAQRYIYSILGVPHSNMPTWYEQFDRLLLLS